MERLCEDDRVKIRSRLLSAASDSSSLENIVQLTSAVVIIFEHSFYIFDKRRYLQYKESGPSFHVALEQYMASPHAAAVRKAVSPAVRAYEEAVATATYAYEEAVATATYAYEEAARTAVYPYQGNLPAWMAKLPFEPFKMKAKEAFERSQAKAKEDLERSQAKEKESSRSRAEAELMKAVLEIALDHRLPRP
ncbi:hypothetical protein EV424DRAFT_399833 [Suillus variegatus]|nr:hypothetical protein EV424DRAFT_399833 [Suillus variegatus]